ncbi:MAG TPA: sugar ABC transporter permease [Streptosporangiaceae bacterium]|nr:sugar ABC transporter permease [Streptosporangiaceae bacterium]
MAEASSADIGQAAGRRGLPGRPGRLLSGRRRDTAVTAVVCLVPFLVLLAIFQYFAIGLMIRNSLYSYSLLNSNFSKFVGFANYTEIFHDHLALQSIGVTLLFALGVVVTQVPLGLGLALLLNMRRRGAPLLRSIVFVPVVTSVVVVTTMWTFIYAPSSGLANSTLHALHLPELKFLTTPHQALPALVIMTLWEEVGFSMMLFLAGLQSIPTEFEEAAAVDGAGPWSRFWKIVLPLLNRTTVLVVVVSTIFALQAFTQSYIMTQGGPDGSTNFMVYNIYTDAFNLGNPGYASALSVVLLIIIIIVSAIQMRALRGRR